MKKLSVIFLIIIFVFAAVPAFAETWKIEKPEDSPFNVMKNWISGFGERSDGTSIMVIKNKESWCGKDEIKQRRESMGVKRGMKRYE